MSYRFDEIELWGAEHRSGYAQAYRRRQRVALAAVEELVPRGARVLDVAAGQGNFSLLLAEAGYRVTWNDLRAELADYVRLKYEHGDIDFRPGNVHDLVVTEPYDAIVMTEFIEHVAHPDRLLARAAELVRPEGYIVLTTPAGEYWRNKLPRFSDCPDPSQFEAQEFKPDADGHIFLLHDDELHELASRAGLKVVRREYFSNSLTAGHAKLGPALRVVPPAVVDRIERFTTSRLRGRAARKVHSQVAAILCRVG
jgi:2-polyprenyl-6-hydroxyphenyl methylase/3-demethylubiquinone-9 3-methyltransferase